MTNRAPLSFCRWRAKKVDPSKDLKNVPDAPGVYIIWAGDGTVFPYPYGQNSPIFYIGMAPKAGLRERLEYNIRATNDLKDTGPGDYGVDGWNERRYYYEAHFSPRFAVVETDGARQAKSAERGLLWEFARTFGAPPVANSALPRLKK